jgi:CRISPR-associated protein Cas5d
VRIVKPIRTQSKSTKPLQWDGGNTLAIYTFLHDVEYQIEAHFEWNEHRPELSADRIEGKHYSIAQRMLARGGRQDIFLGTRDCQAYVEPCEFGEGEGHYDAIDELGGYGLQFHSFGYPDETGQDELITRFWQPVLKHGILDFPRTDDPNLIRNQVRKMTKKDFQLNHNVKSVETEEVI